MISASLQNNSYIINISQMSAQNLKIGSNLAM